MKSRLINTNFLFNYICFHLIISWTYSSHSNFLFKSFWFCSKTTLCSFCWYDWIWCAVSHIMTWSWSSFLNLNKTLHLKIHIIHIQYLQILNNALIFIFPYQNTIFLIIKIYPLLMNQKVFMILIKNFLKDLTYIKVIMLNQDHKHLDQQLNL